MQATFPQISGAFYFLKTKNKYICFLMKYKIHVSEPITIQHKLYMVCKYLGFIGYYFLKALASI